MDQDARQCSRLAGSRAVQKQGVEPTGSAFSSAFGTAAAFGGGGGAAIGAFDTKAASPTAETDANWRSRRRGIRLHKGREGGDSCWP